MPGTPHDQHIGDLRRWRDGEEKDLSLSFVAEHVRKQIGKPHRQLGELSTLWLKHVPAHLLEHTALASLSRGVLTVHVADSATLYELDRLMRAGLEMRIRAAAPSTLRRIKLTVAAIG